MSTNDEDRGPSATLLELSVAAPGGPWRQAGFAVDANRVHLGPTTLQLVPGSGSGIEGWSIAGLDLPPGKSLLDGLATTSTAGAADPRPALGTGRSRHPNGATGIDHVVVSTPDLERTIGAFDQVGLRCRRIRETTAGRTPIRQAFFRLGSTLVEVVGGATGSGQSAVEAPSSWFGLALDVADLEATAALLGDGVGRIKAAVQPGRRIATLRHRRLGLSVATAVMDHHGDR